MLEVIFGGAAAFGTMSVAETVSQILRNFMCRGQRLLERFGPQSQQSSRRLGSWLGSWPIVVLQDAGRFTYVGCR